MPDPGEGLVEAEIITWRVAEGDEIRVNDVLVEIETSKSLVELPSPWAGTVWKLLVPEGATVEVGTPIVVIDDGSSPTLDAPIPAEVVDDAGAPVEPEEGPHPNLVGYGPRASATSRRPRRSSAPVDPHTSHALNAAYAHPTPSRRADAVTPTQPVEARPVGDPLPGPGEAPSAALVLASGESGPALAKPPVRKLARDLGVNLDNVTPTGQNGSITRGDVEAAAAMADLSAMPSGFGTPFSETPEFAEQVRAGQFEGAPTGPEFTGSFQSGRLGGERREPIRGVRKVTAQAMVDSAGSHVHVTEWVTVDVSATMALLEQLKGRREFAGLRVSPLLMFAKAVCLAMGRTPEINASWDDASREIVYHDDVNLGIAAATPRGLMVPNIKGAQRMGLLELSVAISDLVQVAREGKLQPVDYSHGTFTITNVGVFGMDSGTPIINRDESAILCLGSIERRPWVVGVGRDERIEPRWVTTISLSFDHRLIDGEQGSRFLADVATVLREPGLGMLF
ncbi:MAG TPA: dihydrolipoamide acetyltransferase family protein [Propionibacteriaceae bacterium]|nr:dihydrolipoamide acetyltransferase family protein [Propionibacteriaceae bacterium]